MLDLNFFGLLAEIMGKATGVNQGKSGTLHLAVPEKMILMTSTVVGAGPPSGHGSREEAFDCLKSPIRRVAAPDIPVPFSPPLERLNRPGPQMVIEAVRSINRKR